MKRKILLNFIFSICLIIGRPGYAEEPALEADVNANQMTLGSAVQLTITFKGGKPDDPPVIPPIDGVEIQYFGPSTSISVINGQSTIKYSYIYTLFPQKTGQIKIPALTVTAGGKTLTSQPITINVTDTPPGAAQGQSGGTPEQSLKDRIFLTVESPKKDVYVGERVPLTVKLFVNNLALIDLHYPTFSGEGFVIDPFQEAQQYQKTVGGVVYNIVEFPINIYPTRSGEIKIGPVQLISNILFESGQNRRLPSSGSNNFFDDPFFDPIFNTRQKRPVTVNSADFILNVSELPTEGKPEDFSGAVGSFNFDASAGPMEIMEGDPVTLKMKVWGDGHLLLVTMPALKDGEQFKVYDPQIKEESGAKVLEQVIIPKTANIREIPAIRFSFFNPTTKSYQTITKGPFPLKVQKTPEGGSPNIVGVNKPTPQVEDKENTAENIVYIKDDPGKLSKRNTFLYRNPIFRFALFLLAAAWIGIGYFYQRRKKLQSDVKYARRLRAPKKAKAGLEEAKKKMASGQQKEFYDVVFRTLQDYLGDKFHLPSAAITSNVVEREFEIHKIPEEIEKEVHAIFIACDSVRYSFAQSDVQNMPGDLKKMENVIDYIERHWR